MSQATVEISIPVPPDRADGLVGLLSMHGFEGFWEDGETLRAYVDLARWDDLLRAAVRESLAAFASGNEIALPRAEVRIIEQQNWNAAWEATIQPVKVTERITIAPSWHPVPPAEGEIVLIIDPKMSFGTGHHETTRLMLRLMEPRIHPGAAVLDVGTGTGVLAVAALKLGASSATGVDLDEWSILNARENAEANGVQGGFSLISGELKDVPPGMFDIVAANIQRTVIEPLLAGLRARLSPGGRLLLSGLLETEAWMMREAYARHLLIVEEELRENEWIAFALRPG